jgi:hypothetical protein
MNTEHTDEAEETVEVEPSEVLDPGDYNQNQRLKEIHRARQDVRDALEEMDHYATSDEHYHQHMRLAEAVAFYGHELLPLMDEAEWSYQFDETENLPIESVRHFIERMGRFQVADHRYPPKSVTMTVFAKLNQFARNVGLGADLDEGGDEWEV